MHTVIWVDISEICWLRPARLEGRGERHLGGLHTAHIYQVSYRRIILPDSAAHKNDNNSVMREGDHELHGLW